MPQEGSSWSNDRPRKDYYLPSANFGCPFFRPRPRRQPRSVAPSIWIASVFFFQAEDGIRDLTVTGVQTCALPISFSRATEEGTDIYTVNIKDNCCLQRLTVGRFSDNLSPTYSPDGQRIAFVSTRPGLPQVYVMAADGTDQQLFAPFDYGVTGSSNAPDWSPDGQSVAFHRDVGGTLQVFVLDARTRAVRQLTSLGRNEDPTWAPDSRHVAFVSDRSGYRH